MYCTTAGRTPNSSRDPGFAGSGYSKLCCLCDAAIEAPDIAPGDALAIAAGLRPKRSRRRGDDATSMAFLRTPGIERLYSGVANNTASARLMWLRKFRHAAGGVSSRSWLYSVSSPISATSIRKYYRPTTPQALVSEP